MTKYRTAICQMDSGDDKSENLKMAEVMIDEAAAHGADLLVFPETVNYMGRRPREQAEPIPGETTCFFARKAREKQVWIVTGSFPERVEGQNPKNTLALIDPQGNIRCTYSKLHMFDVEIPGRKPYRESALNTAGEEIVLADTELGCLGFAICYDLRFGEMFRLMALGGAKVIFLPSSFTRETGQAHWEALIRARAIENGVYIVAANQTGEKYNMNAYGNSMIVDPWGRILARAGDEPCCIYAEIDPGYADEVRMQIPSLKNRRTDIYECTGNLIRK
ncbi:MAG: carbon-nitrogen hydrolase family protein [Clostridiales bacterium]|nr:carbon-nitrogen hydrolase family protein [Clostridiales bacterium]